METQRKKRVNLGADVWILVMDYLYSEFITGIKPKSYSHAISQALGVTFSHVSNVVLELKKKKLIQSVKNGRIVELELTKKGCDVAENCYHIVNVIKSKEH